MRETEVSRRRFITALSGTLGAAWIAADSRELIAAATHAANAVRQSPRPKFQVLTVAQAADLEAMASQIIPTDDSPGAREMGIVYFMDKSLATFAKRQHGEMVKGLKDLTERVQKLRPGAKSFAALNAADQREILSAMEKDKSNFFEGVRGQTIVGAFANPEYGGNRNKLGWKMIGFDDQFSWAAPFGFYDRPGNENIP